MNGVYRPRTRLIVTADDFGLSKMVDEGILEAFERGVVRNTALLVNFPDFEESLNRLSGAKGGLEVGIHLNLTAGPPVSAAEQVPSLLTKDGGFPGLAAFFGRVARGRIAWSEVMQEWKAQIELGLRSGCRFTSVNSHQHIHMFPPLMRITLALARQYAIPSVRLSRFHRASMVRPLRPKALVLVPFAQVARRMIRRENLYHNDFVIEISPVKATSALRRLCETLDNVSAGVFELVCHPGYLDDTLRSRDALVAERLVDLEILTSKSLQAMLHRPDFQLTTFSTLKEVPTPSEANNRVTPRPRREVRGANG